MAITFNGTQLIGPANTEAVAIGATIPVVTIVTGELQVQETTVTVAKSTVENASAVTTFDALVVAVDVLLNAVVTNDFDATNTVDAYGEILSMEETTVKYTNATVVYTCRVNIFTLVA